jgi:hypothetical protein
MDVKGAIEASLALAVKERMPVTGAFSYDHLIDMKRRIDESDMSYGKLCRWLAWMQAALYHSDLVDLEGLKNLSRGFADPTGPRAVAIAGSIGFGHLMEEIATDLAAHGIPSHLPAFDTDEPNDAERHLAWRRGLSNRFMDILGHEHTAALLIANFDRGGVVNYVGPSAFSEAAVAFSHRKPVYLVADLPASQFREELITFGAIPLRGDLSALRTALAPKT